MSSLQSVVMSTKNMEDKHLNGDEHSRQQLNNIKPHSRKSQRSQQMASSISNALQEKRATSPSDPNTQRKNVRSKHYPTHHHVLTGSSIKGREFEDPTIRAHMKAMATRALWYVAKGNVSICRSITESRALLEQMRCKYNSAMAVMEITAMVEENMDLRKTAFKATSPAAKAILDQLLKVVTKANSELLIPCIESLETRITEPLVKLIDENEPEVTLEAVITLVKFACSANYLCATHCKTIIGAGGVKHLIQLQMVQIPALELLCYIALNVRESQVLGQEEVLIVLEWAAKQAHTNQDPALEVLLPEAKARLELYRDLFRQILQFDSRCNEIELACRILLIRLDQSLAWVRVKLDITHETCPRRVES
ncbi:hypothetical protein Cgig2_003139 [Carnegiea gigantea]|uniref:Uncharacterized protein n=1 Tax=Carnegiea gigantea TaxID=171969 RepID=A0A9Q1GP03_9CARY|nr:hypothetical protein Cgig2_003139 [Carnegiea gigantea]